MFDLKGKTALVTGSSQGIGREIAKALKDAGAEVFVHGTTITDKLKKAAEYVGTEKIAYGDLTDRDISEKIYGQTGGVDILILNASVQDKKVWNEFTEEEFDRHIACNLKSSYFLIKKYTEYMKEQKWGRIVTIGSVNQYNNHPELMIYAVTKAAQMKMVSNIAASLAPFGITVNNIAPGAIDTPRNKGVTKDEEILKKVLTKIPMGYMGAASDMNGAALLLCSEEGRYITGSDIVIDGGMRL